MKTFFPSCTVLFASFVSLSYIHYSKVGITEDNSVKSISRTHAHTHTHMHRNKYSGGIGEYVKKYTPSVYNSLSAINVGVVQRSFLAFHFVRMYSTIVSLPHTPTPKPPICGFLWQQYYTDKTFPRADCVTLEITINNVFHIVTTLYFEIKMKFIFIFFYK